MKDKAKAEIANRQERRAVSKMNGAVGTLVSVHKQASALLPGGTGFYMCVLKTGQSLILSHTSVPDAIILLHILFSWGKSASSNALIPSI